MVKNILGSFKAFNMLWSEVYLYEYTCVIIKVETKRITMKGLLKFCCSYKKAFIFFIYSSCWNIYRCERCFLSNGMCSRLYFIIVFAMITLHIVLFLYFSLSLSLSLCISCFYIMIDRLCVWLHIIITFCFFFSWIKVIPYFFVFWRWRMYWF